MDDTLDADALGRAVADLVARQLLDGPPDVGSVARAMGMSVRTLQRRLLAVGVTFVGIAARTRLAVARELLDDPDRKVIDVALDLGYSDHAHFTRAFSRWTGVPPRDFRRRARTTSDEAAPGTIDETRRVA